MDNYHYYSISNKTQEVLVIINRRIQIGQRWRIYCSLEKESLPNGKMTIVMEQSSYYLKK